MSEHVGFKLVSHFGEDFVRELTEHFPNTTIPGKRFWLQYNRKKFLQDYARRLYRQETAAMLAKRYRVSTRTIYVWIAQARLRRSTSHVKETLLPSVSAPNTITPDWASSIRRAEPLPLPERCNPKLKLRRKCWRILKAMPWLAND